jgi:Cell wall-active antibiotics response LiaF, C-terminal
VIARLSDHFAHDDLDVDEFERRITVAQTSDNPTDIEALLGDLGPAAPTKAVVPTVVSALVPQEQERNLQTAYAIFGGIDRRGAWNVPRRMKIVALFGGANLDLREARFLPGVIDIEVSAVMGGINIVVPPGLAVEMHGSAIMGGFADVNRAPANPDPEAPLLRVHGLAMMGGVNIEMRLPGESERGARRRERHALREERRAQRLLDRQR